jgi:NTE family protein
MNGDNISRRTFLTTMAVATVAASVQSEARQVRDKSDIGLALGGGGARGLAHVLMFEVFDDLGVKPRRIAGTSIGAIMGALYASGLSAKEIRELIAAWMSTESKKWSRAMVSMNIFKWIDLIDPGLGKGGLISSDKFLGFLHQAIKQTTFQKLNIPLKIVATDFWKGEQVVFERGELLPAVKASMALPGIFDPVSIGGRIFIDGGTVNPLPYDLLLRESGTTVAIDVSGSITDRRDELPSFFDTTLRTFHVMGQAILEDKLQLRRPDIYIKPDIVDIKALDFLQSETIYRQATPAKEALKRKLGEILSL